MFDRRRALALGGGALLASLASPRAHAEAPIRRSSFMSTHTGEAVSVVYAEQGALIPDALGEINRVLRDHGSEKFTRSMSACSISLATFGPRRLDAAAPCHVISGYRSPATNAKLHAASAGVASGSLRMRGMAIDIRLPRIERCAFAGGALEMRRGGVGYYPAPDFVHVDVGRVRSW